MDKNYIEQQLKALNKNRILIVGMGGSGKDYLQDTLSYQFNMNPILKYTSRPKRDYETDNVEYKFHFLEDMIILKRTNQFRFVENFEFINKDDEYCNIIYGIAKYDWDNKQNNVAIVSPYYIEQLTKSERNDCLIVFLNIDKEIIRERLGNRSDNDNKRRFENDYKYYQTVKDFDIEITNHLFTILDLFTPLQTLINKNK